MNYISNGTLPIYITLYILFEMKLISICECLNLMTMHVCILSFYIIIIIFILFIFFSVIIGFFFFFGFHVILINELRTFENIFKFLKAPSLFLYFVFIKLVRFCVLVAFCLTNFLSFDLIYMLRVRVLELMIKYG